MRPARPRDLFYAFFRLNSVISPSLLLSSSIGPSAKNPGVNTLIYPVFSMYFLFSAPISCHIPVLLLIPAPGRPVSLLIYHFLLAFPL